jgi:hypothetical protein
LPGGASIIGASWNLSGSRSKAAMRRFSSMVAASCAGDCSMACMLDCT